MQPAQDSVAADAPVMLCPRAYWEGGSWSFKFFLQLFSLCLDRNSGVVECRFWNICQSLAVLGAMLRGCDSLLWHLLKGHLAYALGHPARAAGRPCGRSVNWLWVRTARCWNPRSAAAAFLGVTLGPAPRLVFNGHLYLLACLHLQFWEKAVDISALHHYRTLLICIPPWKLKIKTPVLFVKKDLLINCADSLCGLRHSKYLALFSCWFCLNSARQL